MAEVGTAALAIIPSFKGFQGKLESGSSGALAAAGSSGGQKYGDSAGRSMVSSMGKWGKRAGLAAGAGIAAAGYAAFRLGQDALAEAQEAQKVGRLTQAVIKSTGGAAKISAKGVGDLAENLSNMAGIDDEIIQQGANLLLTFKNVRNEAGKNNDIFNQATASALDLSAAGFGSIESASKMLGKTLNDPVKGITALSRAGVTFTEGQKATISSMVEQNNLLGAQKIILGEVTSQVGGAAKSQATAADRLSVAWGNVKERLGTALLPVMRDVSSYMLNKGIPAAERFVDWFRSDGVKGLGDFADEARPLAREVLPAMGDALGTVRDVVSDAAPYVRDMVGYFNDMPDWAQKAIVGGGLAGAAGSKLGLGKLLTGGKAGAGAGGLMGLVSKAKPLPVYVVNDGMPGVGGGKTKAGAVGSTVGKAGALGFAAAAVGFGAKELGEALFPDQDQAYRRSTGQSYDKSVGQLSGIGVDPQAQADYLALQKTAERQNAGLEVALTRPLKAGSKAWDDYSADALENTRKIKLEADDVVGRWMSVGGGIGVGTRLISKGAEDSQGRLNRLSKTKVDPEFSTPGLPESKARAADLVSDYRQAGKPISTKFYADTSAARAALSGIQSYAATVANAISGISFGGGGGGSSSGGGSNRQTASPRSGRQPMVLQLADGRQLDAYVDERVAANNDMRGERR